MSVSTNNIKVFTKEQLTKEIQRFIIVNVQLITKKIETKKTKVNLKANKIRLLKKKTS